MDEGHAAGLQDRQTLLILERIPGSHPEPTEHKMRARGSPDQSCTSHTQQAFGSQKYHPGVLPSELQRNRCASFHLCS